MKIGDQYPKDNQQKSLDSSEGQQKEAGKNFRLLDKLLVSIVIGTLTYVGFTFANCHFLVPGSMSRANVLGGLLNPPPLDCKESERRGYDALFTLFTALLGLKARMDD